jgi:hypothetical protein
MPSLFDVLLRSVEEITEQACPRLRLGQKHQGKLGRMDEVA